eukprot:GHVU01077841.1.p1 GENE.GHVU01077841.1~~GHVU01077841.1.p1  ORF type:complete len:246 (-),score=28.13 GHVU01077841.1:13-750(-)
MICIILRLLGIGVISDFLADPVLSGFSTASAIIIGTKQLNALFGLPQIKSDWVYVTWYRLCINIHKTNWAAFITGTLGLGVLIAFRFINRLTPFLRKYPIPGPMIVVVLSVVISAAATLDQHPFYISVVGEIPRGLPVPRVPFMIDYPEPTDAYQYTGGSVVWPLLAWSLALAIMYYVIHISVSKTIAKMEGYKIDADQEFVAHGIAGLSGSFFQCYPCATSLSRTSVNQSIGAKTPLHNIPNAA